MILTVERLTITGRGRRFLYTIKNNGEHLFKTSSDSFWTWERKKDALAVMLQVDKHGLDCVDKKLNFERSK